MLEGTDELSDLDQSLRLAVARAKCESSHLFFTRYFFYRRHGIKFIVNWHHVLLGDLVDDVIAGRAKNVIVNIPPGSSKTEEFVINFMARGLAINPRARFLHLSGSNELAALNSATTRDLVQSDDFQILWPLKISDDAKAKKRWNVEIEGQPAGGVYATSMGGQVTGFRAGHMAPKFQGAIIIDDPLKPEDAFSPAKVNLANRKLVTTVKSRRATSDTPIVLIMQRVGVNDPTGFALGGNLQIEWKHVKIPAVLDGAYRASLAKKYRELLSDKPAVNGRCSYWPYKEPIDQLLKMEAGLGADDQGGKISRHVFSSQYQQDPIKLGGNIIRGEHFGRYKVLPQIKFRKIFADTAQKTKERNDFSVFAEWGLGIDGKIYLIDLIRGKWEAPELERRAIAFWSQAKNRDVDKFGQLRKLMVEDKSSGTGLIQSVKLKNSIPIQGIERDRDKFSRVNDVLAYIEVGSAVIPEDAPFTHEFIKEHEAFTADDTHDFDDQVDTTVDAITDMLSTGNKLNQWAQLGKKPGG